MDACGSACKETQAMDSALPAQPHSTPLNQAKDVGYSQLHMQQLADAVVLVEDGLRTSSDGCSRSELINRCFLSSLYEAQLAARSANSAADTAGRLSSFNPDSGSCTDTVPKAMCNLEHATALAAKLNEYEVLTYCAIGLAELQISRRDLAAASATFDGCVASCASMTDAAMRSSLLQRVLPKSMEVCNMQGRAADSFARLQLLNTVLALNGRSVSDDCPICGEVMAPERACLALGCGHSFHRDCCDCWLGRKMFLCGAFSAECPVCTQVDWSLKPTPAAERALEELKVACGDVGSAGGSNGGQAGGDSFMTDSGAAASGRDSESSNGSSSSSSCSSDGGSAAQADRVRRGEDGMESGSSSCCSGSSDDSGAEGGGGGEDSAESAMPWRL